MEFDKPQYVSIGKRKKCECKAIEFFAKRELKKKQKFVGINGTGFFDWQNSKATLSTQKNVKTESVQTNFMEWEDRTSGEVMENGFLSLHVEGHLVQFEKVDKAIDLENI